MFKGNTTMELNEATMINAVQEYIDKRVKEGCEPLVKSVKSNNSNSIMTFSVSLGEKPTLPNTT